MTNPIQNINFKSTSVLTLIAVNLTVLVLAIIFEWSFFELIFTFWAENVVIGIINIPKILMSKKQHPGHRPDTLGSRIFAVFFFCFHYVLFSALHGFLIIILFKRMQEDNFSGDMLDTGLGGYFVLGVALLFISHLISFFVNYVKKKEYENHSPFVQTILPYKRVFIVHGFVMFAGFLFIWIDGAMTILLIAFMLIKILLDLLSHGKEHKA